MAANADAVGFGLATGSLGSVRVPAFKGADPTVDSQTVMLDTTSSQVLEFANNEAYGAMMAGAAWGWNGTIANFRVWHPSRQGVTATPTDHLVIDHITVRGDTSVLKGDLGIWQNPVGVWFSNYMAKTVIVSDADIQGMRVGVASPFYPVHQLFEPGRGDGSVLIERGYFRNYVGVAVATGYAAEGESPLAIKHAVVRGSVFAPLAVPPSPVDPPAAVSMNYRMAGGDSERRDPIHVVDYNATPGDDFSVYYSLDAPADVAPCHDTRRDVQGWVCQ